MELNQTVLSESIDDIINGIDTEITTMEAKIQDLDRQCQRDLILSIVETDIQANNAVSVYDVAKVADVAPGAFDDIRTLDQHAQVGAALNALGNMRSNASPLRLIVGLILMGAGIGLMIYAHLQSKKHKTAVKQVINDIKSSTEAITKNGGLRITNRTVDIQTYAAAIKQVKQCPEAVKFYNEKLVPKWKEITEQPVPDIVHIADDKTFPWNEGTSRIDGIKSDIYFQPNASSDVKKFFDTLAQELVSAEKLANELIDHIRKTVKDYINVQFKAEGFHFVGAMKLHFAPDNVTGLFNVADVHFSTAASMLFPSAVMKFHPSPNQIGVITNLLSSRNSHNARIDIPKSPEETLRAIEFATTPDRSIADAVKKLSDLEQSAGKELGVLDKALAKQDPSVDSEETKAFRKYLEDVRAILQGLVRYQQKLNTFLLHCTTRANAYKTYLKHGKDWIELNEKFDKIVYKWASEKATVAAGTNAFFQSDVFVDNLISRIEQGQATADDVALMAGIEGDKHHQLQSIYDRIQMTGLICRQDVKEIEVLSPGLLSDLPDCPVFTIRPSQNGVAETLQLLDKRMAGLNAITLIEVAVIGAALWFAYKKLFKRRAPAVSGIRHSGELANKIKASVNKLSTIVFNRTRDLSKDDKCVELHQRANEAWKKVHREDLPVDVNKLNTKPPSIITHSAAFDEVVSTLNYADDFKQILADLSASLASIYKVVPLELTDLSNHLDDVLSIIDRKQGTPKIYQSKNPVTINGKNIYFDDRAETEMAALCARAFPSIGVGVDTQSNKFLEKRSGAIISKYATKPDELILLFVINSKLSVSEVAAKPEVTSKFTDLYVKLNQKLKNADLSGINKLETKQANLVMRELDRIGKLLSHINLVGKLAYRIEEAEYNSIDRNVSLAKHIEDYYAAVAELQKHANGVNATENK